MSASKGARKGKTNAANRRSRAGAMLRIAITFCGDSSRGPTKQAGQTSPQSVGMYLPRPGEVEEAIAVLARHGFVVTGRGMATLSVRGTRKQFERAFGTRLTAMKTPSAAHCGVASVLYPAPGAKWAPVPDLAAVIDDAYIQWPHEMPMPQAAAVGAASSRARASRVARASRSARAAGDAHGLLALAGGQAAALPPAHSPAVLDVLRDVPKILSATPVHQAGSKGKGIRVAMLDTGFDHRHPFFQGKGYVTSVALAPGAAERDEDPVGHGTAMSANVLAVAPEVTLIGVKINPSREDFADLGASLLEAFQEALRHEPHVVNISMGYRLEAPGALPNGMRALETEINAAIASGVVVVAAAGNGYRMFPAQMPAVLAVGGAYVDAQSRLVASDYASAFASMTYSGRNVPDFCGLVGPAPHGDYIMLPVPPGSYLDDSIAAIDGTAPSDGWAVLSGTSAAAPQVAGVCALLLQRNPDLKPQTLKALLERTARDVKLGRASPDTDPAGVGLAASAAKDGATGAGLVDAFRAWSQA